MSFSASLIVLNENHISILRNLFMFYAHISQLILPVLSVQHFLESDNTSENFL